MDARRLVQLLQHLESRKVEVWLEGGWGIDALLGEQTRQHDDVDLIATVADSARLIRALGELGYELAHGEVPKNYVLLDDDGHQVDVHPVTFASNSDGIYRMENGADWAFPARGFAGRGHIDGYEVRCLAPEVQVICHDAAHYQFDDDDFHDLAMLHERFGVEVSAEVLDWLEIQRISAMGH